ncbi:MAG: beta-lactamase family protein [Flavobacteriaceae bacterium]
MKNIHLILLPLLFACLSCKSQNQKVYKNRVHNKSVEIYSDAVGKEIKQVVDKYAKKALKDSLINSLSIGLYIDNVSLAFNYGGLTNGKSDLPTNHTIYEIASVTKTFTGTLAAKAVLEGKLNLDDDIRKYLPMPYANLEYEQNSIRVKHLLTHTSGLPGGILGINEELVSADFNEIEFNKVFTEQENKQTKSMFFKELSKIKMIEKPGVKFNYSNVGTNLMGYILEVVYNKPFQELIIDEIVSKNQMVDTHFNVPVGKKNRLAKGYLLGQLMPESNLSKTLWGAEGALKSTIFDMLKYIHYHLKNSEVIKESHKNIYEIDDNYWIGYFWWSIQNQNHDLHYRHDGGISRGKSRLIIYPERKIGFIVFTNQSSVKINQKLDDLIYNIYNELKE